MTAPTDEDLAQQRLQRAVDEENARISQSPTVMQATIHHLQNRVIEQSVLIQELRAQIDDLTPSPEADEDAGIGDDPA